MPEVNRAIAKAETTKPTAVLFTPNDLTKTGIAGKTMPKPSATKNEAMMTTWTSRGNPAIGDLKRLTNCVAGSVLACLLVLSVSAKRLFVQHHGADKTNGGNRCGRHKYHVKTIYE